jgi:hypothetical protein
VNLLGTSPTNNTSQSTEAGHAQANGAHGDDLRALDAAATAYPPLVMPDGLTLAEIALEGCVSVNTARRVIDGHGNVYSRRRVFTAMQRRGVPITPRSPG